MTSLGLHVVWCPKYRRRILRGPVARRLDELLDEIATEHGWEIVASEVMPDHVHLFAHVRPTDSLAHVARLLESRTSRVLRQEVRVVVSQPGTLVQVILRRVGGLRL